MTSKYFYCLLIVAFIAFKAQSQRTIYYDPVKNQINPIGNAFKNGKTINILMGNNDAFKKLYSNITDSIAKDWLSKAKATEKKLKKDQAYSDFISSYLNLDVKGDYLPELRSWINYLDNNYENSCLGFKYFPCLPTYNDWISQKKLFQLRLNGDGSLIDATDKIKLSDNAAAIVRNGNAHVDIDILLTKDVPKEFFIKYYNESVSGTDLSSIDPDDFRQSIQKLSDFLKNNPNLDSLKKVAGSITSKLNLLYRFADTTCKPINSVFKQARDFIYGLDLISTDNSLNQLMKKENLEFFKKWLWYNNGQIVLNPFSFTTSENFRSTIKPDTANARKFNTLINEKIECDVCKTSADTLEYLLRQRKTGSERFSNKKDTETQIADNKAAYNQFIKSGSLLYNIAYPYYFKREKRPVVQEYQIKNYIERCDEGYNRYNKILKLNSNIDMEKEPVIALYNFPSGATVTFTSINKDTIFKSEATLNIDELAGGIGELASLFSGNALITKGIVDFFKVSQPIPTKQISSSVQVPPLAKQQIVTKGINGSNMREFVNDFQQVKIYNQEFTYSLSTCKDINNGKPILKSIFEYIVDQENIKCSENFISTLIAKNQFFCKTEDPQITLKNIIANFIQDLNSKIGEIDKIRDMYILKIEFSVNLLNFLSNIQNLQIPPSEIKTINKPDTAKNYASTKLFYPAPVDENKNSARNEYTLKLTKLPYDTTVSGHFNREKKHWYQLGAGFVGTIGNLPVTNVSSTDPLKFSSDENAFRFTAGIHIYPGRLLNIDNRFFIHRSYGESSWTRLSVFLGVGIPEPLENFYSGAGLDIVPGLRLNTGVRWAWYTKYQVVNNQIQDKQSGLKYGGYYLGIDIAPESLLKILNIFGN